jgi:hypothetical protein
VAVSDPFPSGASFLALGQGLYFVLTGLWPIVHLRSFEMVTGPKTDDWLVKTVGMLVTVIGITLVVASVRGRLNGEIALVAMGSAAVLGAVDVIYVGRGRISRIYLADAVVEALLVGSWMLALFVPA